MKIFYGNGGWLRVDAEDMPGPLYLRYRRDNGLPVLIEMYLDAQAGELPFESLKDLHADLKAFTSFAMQGRADWLDQTNQTPGPDLSRLASYFGTGFGKRQPDSWVAESMHAQYPNSDVKQPPMGMDESVTFEPQQPEPVERPKDGGLSDEFLRTIALNYTWATNTGQNPAPFIKEQSGYDVRTVHSWINKARDRGFLPPTRQGKRT